MLNWIRDLFAKPRQYVDPVGCRQPLCRAICERDEIEESGWWASSGIDPTNGKTCGRVFLCPEHGRDELAEAKRRRESEAQS